MAYEAKNTVKSVVLRLRFFTHSSNYANGIGFHPLEALVAVFLSHLHSSVAVATFFAFAFVVLVVFIISTVYQA